MKLKGISVEGFKRIAKGELDWARGDQENGFPGVEPPSPAPALNPDLGDDRYYDSLSDEDVQSGQYRHGSPQQTASRIYSALLYKLKDLVADFMMESDPDDPQYSEYWKLVAMELNDRLQDPNAVKDLIASGFEGGFEDEIQSETDFDTRYHLGRKL